MNENEKLIEEAAATIAVAELVHTHRTWDDLLEPQKDDYRRVARAALSVFEKAHTPTDDERETLATILATWRDGDPEAWAMDMYLEPADLIILAGFHRSDPTPDALAAQGRLLASRREDLIAAGVDPSDLAVPLHPAKQGEPSDAQVRAGALAMYEWTNTLSMSGATTLARAALRAAGGVR